MEQIEVTEGADRQRARWSRTWFALIALLIAAVAGTAGMIYGYGQQPKLAPLPAAAPTVANPAPAPTPAATAVGDATRGAPESYADLVSRIAPSVVTVRAERVVRQAAHQFPFTNDPFFRRFFGDQFGRNIPPQNHREGGLGSGVIVSSGGYIVTNYHVIHGAQDIKVDLPDHRVFDAQVVGSDPPSDLAVLKIAADRLPALPLGDSDKCRVGDVVLAFGDPLGVGQTVTMGIISAKGRQTGLSDGSFEDFIQTDAPINRGNSGGALVNTRGQLIGVNSQIVSPTGGNIGLGFAIPSNMVNDVMHQLEDHGTVRRGMLGVTVQTVTSDLAKGLGLGEVRGAIVSEVADDSAGGRAGIRRGDVIVAFNGQAIDDANALRNRVAESAPGSKVDVTILRDGRRQDVRVTLGELKLGADAGKTSERGESPDERLGLSLRPLTEDDARELGIHGVHGVLVQDVDAAGAAADAGIQPGDVIEEVNHQAVRSVAEVKSALSEGKDRPAVLLVNRRGSTIYIAIEGHER